MFEGWASEYLANYLGHFCDLQQDQLRISLWRAWRTGLSLENVSLRADAFDYLQLPLKLLSGRVGRIQVQVPWHALRSAPVVIELEEVHLCLGLLDGADLEPGPAGERAWAAKQAQLALAELQAAQEGGSNGGSSSGSSGNGGGDAGEGRKGMLWSFLQHLVTMLVNRLQLRVRNVHVSLQDPSTGLVAGLKLAELRTVPLSEAEHLAVLGDDPFGGLGGRGAIHKQLAIRGLSAYWAPGAAAAAAPAAAAVVVPAGVEAAAAAAAAAQAEGAAAPDALHPLLLPLDATLQVVAQMPGSQTDRSAADLYGEGGRAGEGLRVHAAAVVHSLQLSLHHDQAADMLRLADGLEWLAARSRCAAFRPPGAAAGAPPGIGARRQHWRRMWQHAANAVLADLRGQRDGVRWTDAGTRRRLRLGYIHLYSQHLEAFKPQRRSSGRAALQQAPAAAAAQQQQQQPGQEPGDADMRDASRESPSGSPGKPAAGDSALELELQGLERQLIVADIVLCRQAARLLAQAQEERASSSAPLTPTKRPRGPPDAAAQQDMPPRPSSPFLHQPTAPPSYGAGPALVAAGAADALSAAGARAGIERSRSGHSAAGSETDAARSQRGYISWGLSKLGSLLGYAPTAEGSPGELLEPSESDVRQLYEAVDFDPEQEAGMKPGPRGIQISVDCLLSRASLILRQPPALPTSTSPPSFGFSPGGQSPTNSPFLETAAWGGSTGSNGTATDTALAPGRAIAELELGGVRLDLQLLPEALSVGAVVADVAAHDLLTHGPGIAERMLGRLDPSSATQQQHAHHNHHYAQHVPVLRLKMHWPLPDPAGDGEQPQRAQQQQQPTLDVLVQPLRLHYRPVCLQLLLGVLPAALPGTFPEALWAAVNGLSPEARAAEKAAYLQLLGPAIDILVKVLDVQLLVGASDNGVPGPAAVLSTGAITFHSVRQPQQVALDAAMELLQQRRCTTGGGPAGGVLAGGGAPAAPAAAAAEAATAVLAVEQQLSYQHFEITVAAVQLLALHCEPPGSGGGGGGGGGSGRQGPPLDGGGSRRVVLQPLKLGGALKLHRIAYDAASTQVHCSLQIDPITVSITPAIASHLAAMLALPPQAAGAGGAGAAAWGGGAAAVAAEPCLMPGEEAVSHPSLGSSPMGPGLMGSSTGSSPAKPRHMRQSSTGRTEAATALGVGCGGVAAPGSGSSGRPKPAPAVVVDVRLTSLDASYFVQGSRVGKVEAHAHFSLLRAQAALQVYPTGVEAQVALSGLSFRDLSPEVYSLLPARGPIPHLAKAVSLEALNVFFDGTAHGGRGSTTEVQLCDLTVHGYAGEISNFVSRLHERKPTLATVTIHDTPAALHVSATLNNLLLGHGLLLRVLSLVLPGEEGEEEAASSGAAAGVGAGSSELSPEVSGIGEDVLSAESFTAAGGEARQGVQGGEVDSNSRLAGASSPPQEASVASVAQPQADAAAPAEEGPAGGRSGGGVIEAGPASADGTASAAAAAAEAAGAGPQPGRPTPAQRAAQPARPPAPAAPPSKPVIASIQLTSCRVVCKYRRGPCHHQASLGRGGEAAAAAAGGAPGLPPSALTAAALEVLELHEDILHLDIPSLSLHLPMEPSPEPPQPPPGPQPSPSRRPPRPCSSRQASERLGSEVLCEVALGGTECNQLADPPCASPGGRSPSRMLRASNSSLHAASSVGDARAADAGSHAGGAAGPSGRGQQAQQLLSVSGLTLSLATTAFTGRTMLPVLSVPSVQLVCWQGCAAESERASPVRNLAGVLAAVAPASPGVGSSGGPASRGGSGTARRSSSGAQQAQQQRLMCYRLAVGSVDVGAHPSHVTMAGVLLQQCQSELVQLMRDTSDVATTEGESLVSSSTTPPAAPTVAARDRTPASSSCGESPVQAAPARPAAQLWQFDASVGLVALSLLGSTPSSSCLKLEWHELQCSVSNCGSSSSSASGVGGSSSSGSTGGRSMPNGTPSFPPYAAPQEEAEPLPGLLAGRACWREVSVHMLLPRARQLAPALPTPFAVGAALFGEERAHGGSGASLHDLRGSAAELLYHWSMGLPPEEPPEEPATGPSARRSLALGLGAPEARQLDGEDEFYEASSRLLARRSGSSGVSRYFSAADSEYDDAASEFAEGASSPGGGSPRYPMPLPLPLSSADYDALPLLRLVGGPTPEPSSAAAASAAADGGAPAEPPPPTAVSLTFTQHPPDELLHYAPWRSSLDSQRGYQDLPHEWSLAVASLVLQAHMHGWQHALECAASYAAPAKEVAAFVEAAGAARGAAGRAPAGPAPAGGREGSQLPAAAASSARTPPQGPTAAAPVAQPPPQQTLPQQGAPLGVRVELSRLVVAVVADAPAEAAAEGLGGEEELAEEEAEEAGGLIPAAALTTVLTLTACGGAAGGLQLRAELPMALLSLGVVPRDAAPAALLALPLEDSLLGLRSAEVTVAIQPPPAAPGPLPAAVVAEAAQHSMPHMSVAANVPQVSVWATQRNLSMAAALAKHAQQLAAQLAPLAVQEGEADKGQAVVAAGPGALLTMKLNLHRLALLLSLASQPPPGAAAGRCPHRAAAAAAAAAQQQLLPTPLLELAATALTMDVHDVGVGWLEATVATHLQLDVFSSSKQGWEPVLEPWQCRLEVRSPTTASSHHQHLGISSQQGLELTVTETAAEAAGLLAHAFQGVPEVFERPAGLARALRGACGASTSLSAACWLHNLTGAAVELWVASPVEVQAGQLLQAPAMVLALPGAKVALPVFAQGAAAAQPRQRHAGQPSATTGVELFDANAAQLGPQQAPQLHRTLLYFRLSDQGAPCGPVQLDRLEPSVHVLQHADLGGLPLGAKVVCELEEGRYGGSTITLHSGVKVHNSTEVPLDVGVQTPMGLLMEPQPLGAVQPGKFFWLPVLSAEAGLLCIRPSAGAAQPGAHTLLPVATPPRSQSPAPAAAAADIAAAAAAAAAAEEAGLWGHGPSALQHPAPRHAHALPPAPYPPPHPSLLYSSGRLSPARGSLDRSYLPQLEAAVQQAEQGLADADSGHSSQAAFAALHRHRHEWSTAVALQQLLRPAAAVEPGGGAAGAAGEAHRHSRQLVCHPSQSAAEDQPATIFSMGAASSGEDDLIWDVTISPPLVLHNALPVPVEVTLKAWGKDQLFNLWPNQQLGLHHLEAAHVDSLSFRALGFQPTGAIVPHPIATAPLLGSELGSSTPRQPASVAGTAGGEGGKGDNEIHAPETLVQLEEVGHSHAPVTVAVQHSLNTLTGCHTLRLGCTLWVYNLTGIPISLRQSIDEALVLRSAELKEEQEEDVVPGSWVPPLSLSQSQAVQQQQQAQQLRSGSSSAGSTPLQPRLASPLRHLSGLRSVSREGMRSMHSVPNLLSPTTSLAAPPGTPSTFTNVTTASRAASTADMPLGAGLGEILAAEEGEGRQMASLKRTQSRARGIADSMDAAPQFETPSRWPSMHEGLMPYRHRLRIQVRATQCKAPEGRTYWSDSVELDATVGGAAVVTAPAPMLPPVSPMPAPRAAYIMSVTATQVPGSAGALAVYVLPRYLLHNALDVPIQYKQQGTSSERELEPGAARPLRTVDWLRALRLCVRVQEAGWLWSGGFALDTPGDLFIKIRHRDRGVTMLVRVDVATSASGVLVVTLSHHPAGFAPYRIENCTLETLHARQHKCREQQDVLRPYCSLNYAWDEPALPHKLVLELPGSRRLGIFSLDKVGQDVVLSVPTRSRSGEPERKVRVLVRAEGPTRVLSVLDVNRHCLQEELHPSGPAAGAPSALSWPWRPYVGRSERGGGGGDAGAAAEGAAGGGGGGGAAAALASVVGKAAGVAAGGARRRAVPSGLLWEVTAELASVGLSMASPTHELGYLRAGGLRTTVAVSAARFVVDLEVKSLQLDNPSRWVAHPVTLVLPAPASRLLASTMAATKLDKPRKPAITLQLAVWQRRPAGVLCIEHADLQVAPMGVFVEQQHALQLAAFLSALGASFQPPVPGAAGAAGAAGGLHPGHATMQFDARPSGGLSGGPSLGIGGLGFPGTGGGGPGTAAASSRAMSVNGDLPSPSVAGMLAAALAAGGGGGEARQLLQLQLPPDLLALLSGRSVGGLPQGQKVYIDIMRVGPLDITLSFMPAPWDPQPGSPRVQALQRLLSLTDVEDAHFKLAGLELRHPLMGTAALAQHLQRHYMRAALPELFKVFGAANIFGDPVRLVHHLGLGVWSFLASPAAGLVESARQRGPRQFLAGVASGTRALFANVVFAFSNAATKGSGAARKLIMVLGLDRYDRNWATATFRRRIRFNEPGERAALGGGEGGVLAAMMRGIVGVISEPIRGADEGGLAGFAHGVKRGVLGFVVIPLASLLEMSARMADSIRRAVAGTSCLSWVRPPRYVVAGEALVPYDWYGAMGRWLLSELDRSAAEGAAGPPPAPEGGVLCVPAAARGHYLVATSHKVLYIHAREPMWVPVVLWSAALADLELVARQGSELSMVALRAERTHFMRSMWDHLSDARAKPRGPWSQLVVEAECSEGAVRFEGWVRGAMEGGPRRLTLVGQCQVLAL